MAKWEPIPVPEGSEISTDTMHETLQAHIAGCDQCKKAISETGRHMTSDYSSRSSEFGQRTRMCQKYLDLVMAFAKAEQ